MTTGPTWSILVAETAAAPERLGAEELKRALPQRGDDAVIRPTAEWEGAQPAIRLPSAGDGVNGHRPPLGPEGYRLRTLRRSPLELAIVAAAPAGAMYGAFHLADLLRDNDDLSRLDVSRRRRLPVRSLSTDYGGVEHLRRLVEAAPRLGVNRLVYWWDFSQTRYANLCLYPKYPRLRERLDFAPVREALPSDLRAGAADGDLALVHLPPHQLPPVHGGPAGLLRGAVHGLGVSPPSRLRRCTPSSPISWMSCWRTSRTSPASKCGWPKSPPGRRASCATRSYRRARPSRPACEPRSRSALATGRRS